MQSFLGMQALQAFVKKVFKINFCDGQNMEIPFHGLVLSSLLWFSIYVMQKNFPVKQKGFLIPSCVVYINVFFIFINF